MNFFVCTAGGVAGGTVPVFNPGYGAITPDGTGVWTCVGTSIGMTWAAGVIWNLPVQGFAPPTQFQPDGGSSVVDNNSTPDLEFVINSGISGSSQPTWSTTPTPAAFPNTADTVSAASHAITAVAVSTGIATYTGTFPANNTINGQTILIAGFSTAGNNGLFNILVNTTTTITVTATTQVNQSGATATGKVDLIWVNVGTFTQNALVTTVGRAYAYSYKARALDDFYSVESLTTNANGTQTDSIPIPPGLSVQLPAPTGSETGAVSSASPATVIGANTGAVNTVTGLYSSDPQVDTIVIWRSPDEASGSDDMVELTEIPNIVNTTGTPQFWQFQDYLPDIPTTTANGTVFPGLNTLVPAPIDGVNNPPPSDFLPMAYNYTRIWGSVGQAIDFSGGPDTIVGNPNENFNAADEFPFLSNVIRAVKSTVGLVVFTTASIEIILGGPVTSSFYSVTLAPGIGLGNFNALDIYAGEIYFIDATGQLRTLLPNLSVTSAGFAITDQLVKMNPATVYVAFNEQPNDTALYFGTGATPFNGKTGWFRMNPHQTPGGFQGPEPVWSPFAAITNGCQMLQSIEVSPGVHKLLTGSTLANQSILERNLSVFTDNGTSYDANFQVGSLMLCLRGEIALLKFIESDFALVTTNPTVSYLLDEISGVFSPFTLTPIFDPPSLYGTQLSPLSYNPLRYYFNGTGNLARCVNMQIGIDFGTTANADECFNLSVYGAIVKNG